MRTLIGLTATYFISLILANAQCNLIVAPDGNDSNPGTISAPLATPGFAVSAINTGGTVCLRAGTYALPGNLILAKSLTLQSYPGEWAVVSGPNDANSPVGNVIFVGGNDVTIKNLEVSGGALYGIHVNFFFLGFPPANTVMSGIKVHDSGYTGIKVTFGDNVQILNSEVYTVGATVGGGYGIDILGSIPSSSNPSGPGATVRGTYVHNTPAGIGMKGGTINGLMENNRVENIVGSGGIYVGGETGPQYFRSGSTTECLNCTARNNIVLHTDYLGLTCWGAQGAQIVNNTVIDPGLVAQSAFFSIPDSSGYTCNNAVIKNNIFVTTGNITMVHFVNPGTGISMDNNLFYNANGNYPMWWESPALTGYWGSLSSWQAGTGQDANSIGYQDPMLNAANSYVPLPGSPVIDHGVTLSNVPADYLGVSRPQGKGYDIGALELVQIQAPVPSLVTAVSGVGQQTQVGTAFQAPLVAKVTNTAGGGVAGMQVTFSSPASGPGVTFGGSVTATALTDANGVATSSLPTANASAGSYSVTATAGGLAPALFQLVNNPAPVVPPPPPPPPGPQPTIVTISGGSVSSSAGYFQVFGTVTSGGNPATYGIMSLYVNDALSAIIPDITGRISWIMPIPVGTTVGTQYTVYAVFGGTVRYPAGTSAPVTVTVTN